MTQSAQPTNANTTSAMLSYIRSAFFSMVTALAAAAGITGVSVLTFVKGRVSWWVFALAGLVFVVVVLTDALRRAASAAAEASASVAHTRVEVRSWGGQGGDGTNGGIGGAGGSNYVGPFGATPN
ncbi:hypothetical protein AB0H98_14990 [Nocardia salmonicida]|uniref:hypothetical protein n=1 Tax=Nocardia salmonicida TaxID=53431 RepID=UPI00340C555A